jgi:16S rRNA (cytidine1402-2'-O)-methyltransferase
MSTLYIIATPIGNLEDITLRAIRILKEVDVILCEDTRTTKRLLDTYDIKTKTVSYHAHSTSGKQDAIIEALKEGKSYALVSDAGTPAISDPGALLVRSILDLKDEELKVVAVPGPSALAGALSIAGLTEHVFTFLGFLPHKKGRETLFKKIALAEETMVFYESTHRIMKTLDSLMSHVGEDRKMTIVREMTKMFEEIADGTVSEVQTYFTTHTDKVRGEFVVIIHPK